MPAIRTGCIVTFEKSYFKGSFRNPQFDGKSLLKIEILRHSYGSAKGQHTFTVKILEVINKGSDQTKNVGETMRIKGRNLYPNVIDHIQGEESKKAENIPPIN